MLGQRLGRGPADRSDFHSRQRPCVAAALAHRLEQQLHPVDAGQAHERVGVEPGDRLAHLFRVRKGLNPDGGELHNVGAEPAQPLR
jgi:hypothetical protein